MTTPQRYQVLPPLSPEEYAALKADIAARGVHVPVEYDDDGNILDGFHRVQICQELGLEWPKLVRAGLTDAEKRAHALTLNLTRRHLSTAQKRAIALGLRREGWTQARMAQALGLSQATLSNWLGEFISSDKLPPVGAVQGKDGKRYPSRKVRAAAVPRAAKAGAERESDPAGPVAIPTRHGVEAPGATDAAQASPEPSAGVGPEDLGGRVRAHIDALYNLLIKRQHPGGLRALTEAWSATMKRRYRGRCGTLSQGLRQLSWTLDFPADNSVRTATPQPMDDREAGAPDDSATGACLSDLLGHVAEEPAGSAPGSPVSAMVASAGKANGQLWEEEL